MSALTPEERAELDSYARENEVVRKFMEETADKASLHEDYQRYMVIDQERAYRDMQMRVDRIRRHRALTRGLKIAAVSLVIAVPALYVLGPPDPAGERQPRQVAAWKAPGKEEIKPGRVTATVVLPGGEKQQLSAADEGAFITEVIKEIANETPAGKDADICLDVPRGGEFHIVLEDSTEVWLNAASCLTYPATFAAGERRVRVSGEAYFAVRKDEARPFYVESEGLEVRVYGTTFNVKAYPDEQYTYTTLETGSVSLRQTSGEGGTLMLSPGHQAVYDPAGSEVNMKVVDTGIITGWHNGRFVFEEQPLANIMKDLSRWYDFEYEFTDPSLGSLVFMGSIQRYSDFKTALVTLEKCGGVRFEVEGHYVRVHKIKSFK